MNFIKNLISYDWDEYTDDDIDDLSFNIEHIENDFSSIKLNRERSKSYDSFFDEKNDLKLNNLENNLNLNLNNISKKIDKLTNNTELYIKKVNQNMKDIESKNKLILGVLGGIVISFLSIKIINNK